MIIYYYVSNYFVKFSNYISRKQIYTRGTHSEKHTVCPWSLDPFYILSYCINWLNEKEKNTQYVSGIRIGLISKIFGVSKSECEDKFTTKKYYLYIFLLLKVNDLDSEGEWTLQKDLFYAAKDYQHPSHWSTAL